MNYIENRVQYLQSDEFAKYEFFPSGCNPILYGFLTELHNKLEKVSLLDGTFLYYERFHDGRGILCFRNPKRNFHLIISHTTRFIKGKFNRVTSIKSMQGELSWDLLEVIATSIHPWIDELDNYYLSRPKDFIDISVVDLKSRRTRRVIEPIKDIDIEDEVNKRL